MRDNHANRRPDSSRGYLVVLAIVILVLGASLTAAFLKPVQLGLDLQGGLEVVLKATPTDGKKLTSEQLNQSVEVVRDRVDGLGVAEPEIRTQGSDQIVVSLPGVKDPDQAVAVVGSTAQLRFFEWERNVVDGKAFRSAYEALRTSQQRVKKAAEKHPKLPKQLYLFDAEKNLIAGPAVSDERLLEQARDLVGAKVEKKRPKGWEVLVDDKKLPEGWKSLEAPAGELLVRGQPDEIVGGSGSGAVIMQEGGKFDRAKGAYVLIKDRPGLTGDHVRSASAQAAQGGWSTAIIFDRAGGKKFGKVTERIAKDGALAGTPRRFAIILDDQIKSIPQIDYREYPTGIKGTQAQISGLGDRKEAANLALVLNTGALPVRFEVISKTQVSATLGDESLREGLTAGAAGLAIVMIYLVLFYHVLGLLADLALLAFATIFYAIIVSIPITMTLPGIAGMILTIGVAADANIIIFERIKEEYRAGRSVVQSIHTGYKKGFSTIIDASAVTLITAVLLIVVSIGSVRGFAVLLGIGTLLSIFTAVAFTYALLGILSHVRLFQKAWVIGGSRKRTTTWFHIPWMKYRKYFMILTAVIIVGSGIVIGTKGLNWGVDFRSGTRFDVRLEKNVSQEKVRSTLVKIDPGYSTAVIQETKDTTGTSKAKSSFTITVEKLLGGDKGTTGTAHEREQARQDSAQRKIEQTFQESFGLVDDPTVQTIGPSFGKQVMELAIIAIVLSLILEVFYIWWRFEALYAVPIIISIVHDLLLSAAAFSITGREVKSTTVAALLTIIGYSLYDTIIVFDRIRENVHVLRRSSFQTITTTSLNEVLVRSLNTSIVVLLPTLSLFLFGGETLKDFAFALSVGIAIGVFSSLMTAAPILCWIKERQPAWQKRLAAEEAAEAAKQSDTQDVSMPEGTPAPSA